MRKVGRELWEISKIWWLVVPGGVLGVVAIVQAIKGAHGKSIWFWAFWAMAALMLAMGWRLRSVLKERDLARDELANENTRDVVAQRIDRFAHEWKILGDEAPGEQEGVGPITTPEQVFWSQSMQNLNEQISSELRRNAPGFVKYWRSNLAPMPPPPPFAAYSHAFTEMSLLQLRFIAERLRAGHDEPERGIQLFGPAGEPQFPEAPDPQSSADRDGD